MTADGVQATEGIMDQWQRLVDAMGLPPAMIDKTRVEARIRTEIAELNYTLIHEECTLEHDLALLNIDLTHDLALAKGKGQRRKIRLAAEPRKVELEA